MVFVVPMIRYAVVAERYVAHSHIEKTVRQGGVLKALNGDIRVLIELSCYSARYGVEFYAVELAFLHALGQ